VSAVFAFYGKNIQFGKRKIARVAHFRKYKKLCAKVIKTLTDCAEKWGKATKNQKKSWGFGTLTKKEKFLYT